MTRIVFAPRTVRVIELIAAGVARRDTAARLGISEMVVTRHANRAAHALHVRADDRDRTALVNAAIREGVITLPAQAPPDMEGYLVETLEMIADGYTNAEISAELHLSVDAVKTRVKRILRVLDARHRAQAVAIGWQCGLLKHHTDTAQSATEDRRTP